MSTARGTSNTNARGSSVTRRIRKAWLIEQYRADYDLKQIGDMWLPVEVGAGEPACRCFRCGKLLHKGSVTIDRVLAGVHGGTYRRENIRPACGLCNSRLGGRIRRVT